MRYPNTRWGRFRANMDWSAVGGRWCRWTSPEVVEAIYHRHGQTVPWDAGWPEPYEHANTEGSTA